VIGNDNDGRIFTSLAGDSKINLSGLIIDENRPTTTKTRVIAHNQHVVRIDKESKKYLSSEIQEKLVKYIEDNLVNFDAIILQDYNKGVLTPSLIEKITSLANDKNILITVDPKFNNFFLFKDVTVIKPNRKEAEDVLGMKLRNDDDITIAGFRILEKTNAANVVLTLSEDGIAVFEKNKPEKRMPTKAQIVADVSGAGDTVISTLTMALAAKADIIEASYLANYAGGIVCEEVGIIPIQQDKLFDTIRNENS
jgi:rfaE bifunctional protein kinase chain/domain